MWIYRGSRCRQTVGHSVWRNPVWQINNPSKIKHLLQCENTKIHVCITYYCNHHVLIVTPSCTKPPTWLVLPSQTRNYEIWISRFEIWDLLEQHGSITSKEGDSAFRPRCRGRYGEWPIATVIYEAGLSHQSLSSLRASAKWWFANSHGDVKLGSCAHYH